jgi:hypothetical protein
MIAGGEMPAGTVGNGVVTDGDTGGRAGVGPAGSGVLGGDETGLLSIGGRVGVGEPGIRLGGDGVAVSRVVGVAGCGVTQAANRAITETRTTARHANLAFISASILDSLSANTEYNREYVNAARRKIGVRPTACSRPRSCGRQNTGNDKRTVEPKNRRLKVPTSTKGTFHL